MSDMEARSVIPQPLLEALEYWEASGMGVSWEEFIAAYSPIATRHVGTIAFQGTDAQINEAMQKWLGFSANAGTKSGGHLCALSETPIGDRK